MAGNVIDEFFVSLGFVVEKAGVTEFEARLTSVAKKAAQVTAAIAATVTAIGWFTAETAYAVDELGDFAEREDVAVEALSAFGHAAQIAGSSLEAVKSSVEGANRVIGEAALGIGRGATAFKDLGLDARNSNGEIKNSFELLEEVADRFIALSSQEAIAMAEKLGIDRSLIPLLKKGAAGIAELTNEAQAFGVVTTEQAAAAGDLTDSLDRSKFVFGAVQRQLATALMPTLLRVSEGVRDWVMENKELIKSGIDRFVKVVTAATVFLGKAMAVVGRVISGLLSSFDSLYAWLTKTKLGLTALYAITSLLTGGAAILAWQMLAGAVMMVGRALFTLLANPVVLFAALIGAAIVAVGLLVNDVMTWMEGGDSLVGRWLGSWDKVRAGIIEVWDAFSAFVVAVVDLFFGPLFNAISGVVSVVGSLAGAIGSGLAAVGEVIWAAVRLYFGAWAWVFEQVLSAFGIFGGSLQGAWTAIWDVIGNTVSAVGDFISGILDAIIDRIYGLRTAINAAKALGSVLSNVFGGSKDESPSGQKASGESVGSAVRKAPSLSPGAGGGSSGSPAAYLGAAHAAEANSLGNNSVVNNNTTTVGAPVINIKSSDPKAAGKEVSRELEILMRNTRRNTQNGVAS